jgi:epoxyqueuosine reductase
MTEITRQPFKPTALVAKGLNLSCVFDLAALPELMTQSLSRLSANYKNNNNDKNYNQLILIGHGGQSLWQNINLTQSKSQHPIDDFSHQQCKKYFQQNSNVKKYQILFPQTDNNQAAINLQALGELAGWHNDSPFKVGINHQWGTWFAYRAVILTESNFKTTNLNERQTLNQRQSPCSTCSTKICISSCPAGALNNNVYDFESCVDYRQTPKSKCADRCVARMACPVAFDHQYKLEQTQYHYGRSLETLRQFNLNDRKSINPS